MAFQTSIFSFKSFQVNYFRIKHYILSKDDGSKTFTAKEMFCKSHVFEGEIMMLKCVIHICDIAREIKQGLFAKKL